jgi:hypothetical protein
LRYLFFSVNQNMMFIYAISMKWHESREGNEMGFLGIGDKNGGGLLGGLGNLTGLNNVLGGAGTAFSSLLRGDLGGFAGGALQAGQGLTQAGQVASLATGNVAPLLNGGFNPLNGGFAGPYGNQGGFNPASLIGLGGNQGQQNQGGLFQRGYNAITGGRGNLDPYQMALNALGLGNAGGIQQQQRSPWDGGSTQNQNNAYGQYPYGTPSFNPKDQSYYGYGNQNPMNRIGQGYGFNIFA